MLDFNIGKTLLFQNGFLETLVELIRMTWHVIAPPKPFKDSALLRIKAGNFTI